MKAKINHRLMADLRISSNEVGAGYFEEATSRLFNEHVLSGLLQTD